MSDSVETAKQVVTVLESRKATIAEQIAETRAKIAQKRESLGLDILKGGDPEKMTAEIVALEAKLGGLMAAAGLAETAISGAEGKLFSEEAVAAEKIIVEMDKEQAARITGFFETLWALSSMLDEITQTELEIASLASKYQAARDFGAPYVLKNAAIGLSHNFRIIKEQARFSSGLIRASRPDLREKDYAVVSPPGQR